MRQRFRSLNSTIWPLGLLCVIVLAVYSRILGNEFVAWDDNILIYENPHFHPVTFASLTNFWAHPYDSIYTPLSYTFLGILALLAQAPGLVSPSNLAIFNFDPRFFHLASLSLHCANTTLVFLLLRNYSKTALPALGGALLFSLHPVQVETVAWASEVKGLLCAFLALLAIWQYVIYAHASNQHSPDGGSILSLSLNRHYLTASLCFLLALMAKPVAVTTPLLAWLLASLVSDWSWKKHLRLLALWLLAGFFWTLLTRHAQPVTQQWITPVQFRPIIAGDALLFYCQRLILPFNFSIDYGRTPQWLLAQKWSYFTWLVPIVGLIILWLNYRRCHVGAAAATLMAAWVLPVLGLVPFVFQTYSTVADRYLYLGLLGPALGFTAILQSVPFSRNSRPVLSIAVPTLAILSIGLALCVQPQLSVWNNTITLLKNAISVNPRCWVAHNTLGTIYERTDRFTDAQSHFEEAIRIRPEYPEPHLNLGVALLERNAAGDAIKYLQRYVELAPHSYLGFNHLGVAYSRTGNLDKAIAQYRQSLTIDGSYARTHYNLGVALERQGKTAQAMEQWKKALENEPGMAEAHANLGVLLARQGENQEAIIHLEEAHRLRPEVAAIERLLVNLRLQADTASRRANNHPGM